MIHLMHQWEYYFQELNNGREYQVRKCTKCNKVEALDDGGVWAVVTSRET